MRFIVSYVIISFIPGIYIAHSNESAHLIFPVQFRELTLNPHWLLWATKTPFGELHKVQVFALL